MRNSQSLVRPSREIHDDLLYRTTGGEHASHYTAEVFPLLYNNVFSHLLHIRAYISLYLLALKQMFGLEEAFWIFSGI
jgi:hypothetical protein